MAEINNCILSISGLIMDFNVLEIVVKVLKETQPGWRIVWDPIFRASAGFQFHGHFEREQLFPAFENCCLITPNTEETIFIQ